MNKKTEKQALIPEKKYWSSMDEYHGVPGEPEKDLEKEHKASVLEIFDPSIHGAKASRRDFLKLFGFSVTGAALAASCERPVQKAIPYVIQPEEIIPGKSLHYASTFFDGKDYCSILVKSREGRPIKIEGNSLSSFNGGGTTARVQASLLSLYDDARYKNPSHKGVEISWEEVDKKVLNKLEQVHGAQKEIILVTPTLISPSTLEIIANFRDRYSNLRWVQYDAISYSAIREAHKLLYGKPVIPGYKFDNADVVVSFGADFLGTWLAPVHYIPMYAKRKRLHNGEKSMLRHYQFESNFSLTGSNADHRIPISPREEKDILISLYNSLAEKPGRPQLAQSEPRIITAQILEDLLNAGSRSLVVSGSNDPECQMLVAGINEILGSVGTTIDLHNTLNLAAGNDGEMEEMIRLLQSDKTGAVLFYDVNPVYDYPGGNELKKALADLELSVALTWIKSETAEACQYICPTDHYLESWGDAEVMPGVLSLAQPLIHSMFDTRCFQNSLLKWMGREEDYHDYLKSFWKNNYWDGIGKFEDFWTKRLRDGVCNKQVTIEEGLKFNSQALSEIKVSTDSSGFCLTMVESVQMGDGKYANNPWLQELPDPIAKVCWDNFVSLSPADAGEMGLANGDIVRVNDLVELPVMIQPGQARSTASIALGYGRDTAGKVGDHLGANAFPLIQVINQRRKYYLEDITIQHTGNNIILAFTQTHNSMEGRPIVREANLDEYLESPTAGNELHEEIESHHRTLYPEVEFDGLHWGLAVDLNACVGCNACVIGCQAENNIPVVGKDEVYRRRIMHWIKIDRYYSEDPENPKVSFQPNMCQHCDNAPCENVCPVSATNHSSEGLNQMSYNRCIGTKYCINNCPYRARRFNWFRYINNDEFDYNTHSDLGRLVLNPDVTVRSRGVVEKCSFCVQRIQEKKLQAKLENRHIADGEIQPACAQACPAGALVFGNLKDKNSKVSQMFAGSRNYHLLEELHTLPSVGYLTKIRNERKS